MNRQFIKFGACLTLLRSGCEIYTYRDSAAPYRPLHFELWNGGKREGRIHHATIKKLISSGIIHGTESKNKYKLVTAPKGIKE